MRLSFDLTGAALRPFCPTRWTAKAKSFESVLHNCAALQETLISISVVNYQVTCLEVTTKASGIHAKLETFGLFFCYSGLHQVYSLTDQLSTTLQCMDITATEAKKCAEVL